MLAAHKASDADCTIAVIEVPLKEASRFGILTTDDTGRIIRFTEKPKNPDSTKASMGIYIFKKDKLVEYLTADAKDPASSNDFGKNVIPAMLAAGEKMMTYAFSGYWKDVGTIDSLWEANMDLLGEKPELSLNANGWRVLSRHQNTTPQYIGPQGVVENSSITEGCEILGTVRNSVLGENVRVLEGAVVEDAVLMGNCEIGPNAEVRYCIVDCDVKIGANAKVGKARSEANGIAVIGEGCVIEDGGVVADGQTIPE